MISKVLSFQINQGAEYSRVFKDFLALLPKLKGPWVETQDCFCTFWAVVLVNSVHEGLFHVSVVA